MNTAQRNFLIKKITETAQTRMKVLRDAKPSHPSIENHLLHAILSGTLKMRPEAEILEVIKQKAIKGGKGWMDTGRWGDSTGLTFKPKELFDVPEEYARQVEEYSKKSSEIENEINHIQIQLDTLTTRIQLASDKTLQKMINEVDDMGDLSLMDTTIKSISGFDQKKIQ